MNTDPVLKILKENKGRYISGQEICEKLGVSRTAVWKHMNTLREIGYEIDSVTKNGYRLKNEPDLITYNEVEQYLKTSYIARDYVYNTSVDSTNALAKRQADMHGNGALFIAEEQTAGRGRTGRSWSSPKGTGIWMTILLKPHMQPFDAPLLTHVAALAVADGIKEITGIVPGIKWPNDIIINNKKVCGILTELSTEIDLINYIIIGIGINVNTESFPSNLKDIATSLKIETGNTVDRKALTASILNNFEILYERFIQGHFDNIIEECKKLSVTLGRIVKVKGKNGEYLAKAFDINKRGELIVERQDGKRSTIIAGDVSVRGVLGYV